jgi:hypothetical protein
MPLSRCSFVRVLGLFLNAALLAACGAPLHIAPITNDRTGARARHGDKVFSFTGGEQQFVVPAGVRVLKITVSGATGWGDDGATGGLVKARVPVQSGETLSIYVGGAGSAYHGGYNGGARGYCYAAGCIGGGGGGASDVRQGGDTLADRIIVAGGGGGSGSSFGEGTGSGVGGSGGDGGGVHGDRGLNATGHFGGFGAGGGTRLAGGVSGRPNPGLFGCDGKGHRGRRGSGGVGGGDIYRGSSYYYNCGGGGGGGGGGYFGGGGGGAGGLGYGGTTTSGWFYRDFYPGGGGGGGSGYIEPTATNALEMVGGAAAGNGNIVIRW